MTQALATVPSGITLSLGTGGAISVPTQPATFTVTSLNSGINFPANSVVVVAFYEEDGSSGISSPLIGGQAASLIAQDASNLFFYSVLVGGSSIADTFGGSNGNFYTNLTFRAWILNGATSATPTTTKNGVAGGADPQVLSAQPINVPSGGIGLVALGCSVNFTAGTTTLWGTPSGSISPDASSRLDAHYLFSSWNTTTSGNWDPGVTGSSTLAFKNNTMIAVSFP